jgi:large subunit ribosomal protein L29
MNPNNFHNQNIDDLKKEIDRLFINHFNLRMQKSTQSLSDHTQLGKTRKIIARAFTILTQKQRAIKNDQ